MDSLTPQAVSAADPRLAPLFEAHLALMRASSPICSVHAMGPADLDATGAQVRAIFDNGEAIAMGALKPLPSGGAELKSMHVRQNRRGAGLADAILTALEATARAAGHAQLWLETGSADVFAPARAFYRRHGFAECPPFEGYDTDPESAFFTKRL